MQDNKRLFTLAGKLRPLAVKHYAESRRWEAVDGVDGRLWVFRHPDQRLRQIIIPMDADDAGFSDAMMDVAQRLAELESRDILSVLTDLQHPDADILRFRVATPETEAGDLPLGQDVNIREGARKALLASACSIIRPARHHARMTLAQAEQFIGECRSGQTELGSYVLRVVCPLHAADEGQAGENHIPFARRATQLLLASTAGLVGAIEADRVDPFLEANQGVSSNLCDALLRMQPPAGNGRIEILANWAADPNVRPPVGVPSRVSIPAEYFPEIDRVYRRLRPAGAIAETALFVGTVESLNGELGDDGRRAGEVILSLLDSEGEQIRARANLNADAYAEAVRAHEDGRGYVLARGSLVRGVRISTLAGILQFGRLPRPAAD